MAYSNLTVEKLTREAKKHYLSGSRSTARNIYIRVLKISPRHVPALSGLAEIALAAGRLNEAELYFRRAVSADANAGYAWHWLSRLSLLSGKLSEATDFAEKAAVSCPGAPNFRAFFANLLSRKGRIDAALKEMRQAVEIDEIYVQDLVQLMRKHCIWKGLDKVQENVFRQEAAGISIQPFLLGVIGASSSILFRSANQKGAGLQAWAAKQPKLPPAKRSPHRRLRLGYISGDFQGPHPTTQLITEVLETHDRDKIELFGFSYGRKDSTDERTRLVGSFDDFQPLTHVRFGIAQQQSALRI